MLQGGFSLHWRKCSCLQHLVELLVNYGIQYTIGWTFCTPGCTVGPAAPWFVLLCGVRAAWTALDHHPFEKWSRTACHKGIATHPALGLLHFKPNPPSAFCPPPGTHNPTPNPPPKQKSKKKIKTKKTCNACNFV